MRKFLEKVGYRKLLLILWIILPIVFASKQVLKNSYNNYLIFKYVFVNTINNHPLFTEQPEYFFDSNHYGPFFAVFFAPFALLPDLPGAILWAIFNSLTLFYAITKLPVSSRQQNLILLISSHELITSLINLQINPFSTALIILTFVFATRHKEILSGLMIAIGFLIKLYGIVGFAFILFCRNWFKYIFSFLAFTIVLGALPLLISSPQFQIQGYYDWYDSLSHKNELNITSTMQNISVMGLIQKNIYSEVSVAAVLIVGMLLMLAMVGINIRRFQNERFRLLLLSAVLLFTVLFSTGSESATYIIAFVGIAIWYATKEKLTAWDHFLLTFALVLTSLSPTDLFPPDLRQFIRDQRLKALPCVIIWLEILRESYFVRPKAIEV